MQETAITRMQDKSDEVQRLYDGHTGCLNGSNVKLEFLSKAWLQHWLKQDLPKADTESRVIDNSKLLCRHGNLCLNKVADMKCTASESAQAVLPRYERRPRRLLTTDLCRVCVLELVRAVKRAPEEKELLKDLFLNKKRPELSMNGDASRTTSCTTPATSAAAAASPSSSSSSSPVPSPCPADSSADPSFKYFAVSSKFCKKWRAFLE